MEKAGEATEESDREAEGEEEPNPSLFPLFPLSDSSLQGNSKGPQWLSNTSFTTDLSVVEEAVTTRYNVTLDEDEGDADEHPPKPSPSYEMLDSSTSDRGRDEDTKRERRGRRKKKKKKRSREVKLDDFTSRKSGIRAWAGSDTRPSKDYYVDSRGDRDNLAFGSLYRMDVARYKLYNSSRSSEFQDLYRQKRWDSILDKEADIDALDGKLKSGGRYWSAKYSALERYKDLKRIRIIALDKSVIVPGEFIPLIELQPSRDGRDSASLGRSWICEESWEEEVLRRTREFNKMSRESPHDEKVWLAFAQFQDRVASMQPQKAARLQTLEKKISILEKATELNPENEELLLFLMKAYQSRDSSEVLINRWEKILMQNSGSYKLWKEFLCVLQGDFSRLKVSDMRKMYAHAIQALSSACSKLCRQVNHREKPNVMDPAIIRLELGLVDIFLSLCRFEWQVGYQELAAALFQGQIEYSLFCPSLLLSEQSKQRLFEHFWNSNGARLGEVGALGWSVWLEKEEENRQKVITDESVEEDEGGWSGWSEPLSKINEISKNPENLVDDDVGNEAEEEFETAISNQEDDTEELLKKLGIDIDAEANNEIKDTTTWIRWSEEEMSRDIKQWMPVREKSAGASMTDDTPDGEGCDQILRVILFEDICEHLFSLCSEEARFSLIYQFIDFFGGKISQWTCTNSSSWIENTLSLESLSDSLSEDLRKVHEVISKTKNSFSTDRLESLLGSSDDTSRRTNMMKFLRDAILLLLTAFPRNYVLEEAALDAEELFMTRLNSCTSSVTPSRALAKCLLKNDRQDILLCGVYARREGAFGNIDLARKVFEMALSSIEGLPLELQENAPLLYFWFVEMELANCSSNDSESCIRAIHILSCLGSGTKYGPFKCQPSSLQVLRTRQGFKERIRTLRATWARGDIKDHSIALIFSAALFEELTAGWAAGIEVLEEAFSMVLPERRSQSSQLEYMLQFYIRMLQKHRKQCNLSRVWESLLQGLQIYPYSPKVFTAFVEIGHLYTVPNKLRRIFDEFCHKKSSVIVFLFALSFEMSRGGSPHRIHGLFERALANDKLHSSVLLWRCYISYQINIACNPSAARRIFFRAIHACPWSKKLWLDGFLKLNTILTAKELSDLQEVMRDKELNLRTDIYEILLQDEMTP